MNESLTAEFTEMEIKVALDQIGDLKTPGPDGMPAVVFKKYWHFMGQNIVQEVMKVLKGGEIPVGWNDTNVVLIPKVKNPTRIKDRSVYATCCTRLSRRCWRTG